MLPAPPRYTAVSGRGLAIGGSDRKTYPGGIRSIALIAQGALANDRSIDIARQAGPLTSLLNQFYRCRCICGLTRAGVVDSVQLTARYPAQCSQHLATFFKSGLRHRSSSMNGDNLPPRPWETASDILEELKDCRSSDAF